MTAGVALATAGPVLGRGLEWVSVSVSRGSLRRCGPSVPRGVLGNQGPSEGRVAGQAPALRGRMDGCDLEWRAWRTAPRAWLCCGGMVRELGL